MRHNGWLVTLALLGPGAALAKPVGTFEFIVAGPGDETRPSIDGQYVVYSGLGESGAPEVLLYNTKLGDGQAIAGDDPRDPPGAYDLPDVSFSTAIYRGPRGISIEFWQADQHLRDPPAEGDGPVSAPTIASGVAAWEVGEGARDVRVNRWGDWDQREHTLRAPDGGAPVGDQHAPAAYGDLVAYVDGADRHAVWLYDSAAELAGRYPFARVCDGLVTGVSVGSDGGDTFVAVARATDAHDEDVEVWPAGGATEPVAALRVPGVQRNPHVAGPWVAFEDVSTQFSQVVVWNWRTGLVFVPHPSATQQVLNDLSLLPGEEVRVVFEDSLSPATGRDIALYVLVLAPWIDDGRPGGYPLEPREPPPDPEEPARCDGVATPLATLHLGRSTGKPLAGETEFEVDLPQGAASLPVLVCIDAARVSAAWVTLDDEAIARPSDFRPSVVHLEVRGEVQGRAGRISGVIAGKPGAALDVRVLADPARRSEAAAVTEAPAHAAVAASGGCATAPAGAVALAALALVIARRRPRRG
ncbi:MAG TPA: hypothetical protein VFL83_22270 [Anaeromyxobacter sp.]|nr:hypothetical protein [Anaeromyxobacter sp.]